MRITDVEALLLRGADTIDASAADGSQDGLVVRIRTDEGIDGLGEIDSQPHVAKAIVEAPASHKIASGLARLLIGQDPLDVDALWQRMYDGSVYYGRRGAVIHAISGLEIALWDIAGKAAGKPVCELLGGANRDRVKAYASTLMPETPDETRRAVESCRAAGFGAVKLGWGPLGRDPDLDVALVAAARAAAGDDCELMIDVGFGWATAEQGIATARRLAEFKPRWIEEPFWPDRYDSYRALVDAVDTPIAAGEEETTRWDFERLMLEGGVAVVQPDVTRVGGMRECLRVEQIAARLHRQVVLHAWSTGIIKAASLHVTAALQSAHYLEYCVQETPLNRELVVERFDVRDGEVAIPSGPGLGVTLDEEVLRRCLVR
jgi:L-alanine-DL-glutamate epimerase-like enolase superfamily enzyme